MADLTRQNKNSIQEQIPFSMGILAHVDAGKTTLAESLLYLSGQIRSLGRVDHKDAFLDHNQMERDRGITIFSKQARFLWKDLSITLLDTPGHVDFSAEMERTLQVLDLAVLVISGADGVQGHTETVWRLLRQYDVPVFLFVNKMDQPGTDAAVILEQLQKKFGPGCVRFDLPDANAQGSIGPDLDQVSMSCERLMNAYLENGDITDAELVDAISERELFPVYFGSALKVEGVEQLLDGIAKYAPHSFYEEDFGARVFKITRDDNGNRLTHMKVTGGRLRAKQILESGEKVDQLRLYDGTKYETVESVAAGEIVAVTGLTKTHAGQGLGEERDTILPILEPVLVYAMHLPEDVDSVQALGKLKVLEDEDPQLHIIWEEEIREIHVQVMGEVQIEILKRVIWERFGMDVSFGTGRIVYKETIAAPSYGIGHFEPLRHYAEVQLLLEPGERGSGIVFYSLCSEDILDKNWQRLIQTHVEETIHRGTLVGGEVTDLRVILMTGRAHPKHTEGGDFRQATYRAIRNGLRKAERVLLEPVFSFYMELPVTCLGRAMTDVERLYGRPNPPQLDGETAILTGTAPVSTFWDYQRELAAYTAGRGHLSCALSGYEPCHNAQEVVEAAHYDSEADLRRPTGSVFCAHGSGFQVPWDQVEAYAHMVCPIDWHKMLGQEGYMSTKTVNLEAMQNAIAAAQDTSLNLQDMPQKEGEEKWISIEEIDAILNQTYRKNENRTNAGWHRGNRSRRTVMASGTQEGGSRKPKPVGKKYFLVDGYNIIFAWDELREMSERNIDSARDMLIDICCDFQGHFGGDLILVFDAYKVKGNSGSMTKINNIYVVYTKEAETADAYIEKATHQLGQTDQVTVATSDRLEQMIIWGNGALRMSAREFHEEVDRCREKLRVEVLEKDSSLQNRPFASFHL